MPKALKWLLALIGGIPASILGRVVWESSLCDSLRGERNPLTQAINWLITDIGISRLFFLSMAVWLCASCAYIFFQFRRITIHAGVYASDSVQKDVTEFLRNKVEREGARGIRVQNELLGCDPDKGKRKTLTVDYSVWGVRRKKQKMEREHFKFNRHDT